MVEDLDVFALVYGFAVHALAVEHGDFFVGGGGAKAHDVGDCLRRIFSAGDAGVGHRRAVDYRLGERGAARVAASAAVDTGQLVVDFFYPRVYFDGEFYRRRAEPKRSQAPYRPQRQCSNRPRPGRRRMSTDRVTLILSHALGLLSESRPIFQNAV